MSQSAGGRGGEDKKDAPGERNFISFLKLQVIHRSIQEFLCPWGRLGVWGDCVGVGWCCVLGGGGGVWDEMVFFGCVRYWGVVGVKVFIGGAWGACMFG